MRESPVTESNQVLLINMLSKMGVDSSKQIKEVILSHQGTTQGRRSSHDCRALHIATFSSRISSRWGRFWPAPSTNSCSKGCQWNRLIPPPSEVLLSHFCLPCFPLQVSQYEYRELLLYIKFVHIFFRNQLIRECVNISYIVTHDRTVYHIIVTHVNNNYSAF